MNTAKFVEVSDSELLSVNGGALGGAVIGFMVGGTVGYIVGAIAYNDSIRSGSSRAMAQKAGETAYMSSCATGAIIGAYLPF